MIFPPRPFAVLMLCAISVSAWAEEKTRPAALSVPTQVEIESKFIEITSQGESGLGADFVGGALELRAVYTEAEFQNFLRAINQKKGVDFISAPKVATKFGNKVYVRIVREFPYPTTFGEHNAAEGYGVVPTSFITANLGITLECEPYLNEGGSVTLKLSPEAKEFNGFVNVGGTRKAKSDLAGDAILDDYELAPSGNVINQPIFSTRSTTVDVALRSGETVVLELFTGTIYTAMGEDFKALDIRAPKKTAHKRSLFVFVTPRLLNSQGSVAESPASASPFQPDPFTQTLPPSTDEAEFYGVPVPDKAGFITSPFAPAAGYVDIRGYATNTEVKDPYTGQMFLVPASDGSRLPSVSVPKGKANPVGSLITRKYWVPPAYLSDLKAPKTKEFWKSQGLKFPAGSSVAFKEPRELVFHNTLEEHAKLIELLSAAASPK